MIMSLKQWKMKFKPRIKLNHNIYMIKENFFYHVYDIKMFSKYYNILKKLSKSFFLLKHRNEGLTGGIES